MDVVFTEANMYFFCNTTYKIKKIYIRPDNPSLWAVTCIFDNNEKMDLVRVEDKKVAEDFVEYFTIMHEEIEYRRNL